MRLIFAIFTAALCTFAVVEKTATAAPAQRKVNFIAAGKVATAPVETALAAECVITITNSGPTTQVFDLNVTGSAASSSIPATYNGAVVNGTASGLSGCSHSLNMANCSLATQESAVITYTYPSIPQNTVAEQFITCNGTIRVRDNADNAPGFVVANGSLMTFLPTTQQDVEIRTCDPVCRSVWRPLKANVAFSQVQILIGEGRPF